MDRAALSLERGFVDVNIEFAHLDMAHRYWRDALSASVNQVKKLIGECEGAGRTYSLSVLIDDKQYSVEEVKESVQHFLTQHALDQAIFWGVESELATYRDQLYTLLEEPEQVPYSNIMRAR